MKIKAIGINARFTHSCLALFYIRHELQSRLPGADVEICQYTINDSYYSTVQNIVESSADYLFFSAVIWNSELIEQLIHDVLEIEQDSFIVVGGPQAEVVGERFRSSGRVCVFSGNIEAAGQTFYDDLLSKRLQKHYQASFLQSRPGELPYPYQPEDFGGPLKDRYIYYESSRGCPFSCTYCLSSYEKGLYHKKRDQVFQEIDAILQHDPKTVRFVDRTFNDVPGRALEIWRYLGAREGRTLFHFEIAPDRFTPEIFDFLDTIRPGLFQFEIGIQSTNPQTLAAINRPIDMAPIPELIKRLRQNENIHLHVDLILGLPFDTPETFCNSINEVFRMEPHYIQMGLLKLLPDTPISGFRTEYGYLASSKPPYAVFASRWMNPEVLRHHYRLGECIERSFNNRYFISFWHYLISSGEDMAAFFLGLSELFGKHGYFEKATTQETLSRLLLEQVRSRPDKGLLRELLCYDWLRCGHRFLPDDLAGPGPPVNELRRALYRRLPDDIAGIYDHKMRSNFIKKSVFQPFSRSALEVIGFQAEGDAVLCFSPERESSVYRLHKSSIVEIID